MSRLKLRRLAMCTMGMLCLTSAILAEPVGLNQGLEFSQFNLTFPGAAQPSSAYGLAAVDSAQLTATTDIPTGFLNISTSAGWVVQNMLIDVSSGYPGSSTMFNLGNTPGNRVTGLEVYADFSPTPTVSFNFAPTTTFSVGELDYNAQGRNAPPAAPPPSPITPIIDWLTGGPTSWIQQLFRKSVEQDTNQCGPGSLANSLQYLKDEYGIRLPHDHVPGIDGKPPSSLVGEIDKKMKRVPHQTVGDANFMAGKLEYIATHGLGDKLILKHWGGTFVPGNQTSDDGTVTSTDESTTGISLIDWIIQEIEKGEDVELALGGTVMHWVNVTDAGRTLGIPWISWTHDANQGYDDKGTPETDDDTTLENGGTNWWDGGVGWSPIIGGKLVFFIEGAQLDFAVSESIPEPATLVLLVLGGLALLRRRSR